MSILSNVWKCILKPLIWFCGIIVVLMICFCTAYHFWYQYRNRIFQQAFYHHQPPALTRSLPNKNNQQVIRILSISSGGIYGIIPATVLMYLERQTGKPINQLFDVMIGTSTGAIPLVLLTTPNAQNQPRYKASDVLNFYHTDSPEVFYAPWLHRLLSLDGVLEPKYISLHRYNLFNRYFGDLYFNDLLNNVVILAYGLSEKSPLLFHNWVGAPTVHENFKVSDLLLGATSPPATFTDIPVRSNVKTYGLIDGALFAQNPALAGLITAMKIYPNKRYLLVSLGTGQALPDASSEDVATWGAAQWAAKIMPTVIDATGKFNTILLQHAFGVKNASVEYIYLDTPVSNVDDAIDNYSAWNITRIDQNAQTLIQQNKSVLNKLAKQLSTGN